VALSTSHAATLAPDPTLLARALADIRRRPAFRDLPVDWLDAAAGTWRPTAIAQAADSDGAVHVFVPLDEGIAMAPARCRDLRLAEGQSDAVMRFWTIRYRLRLLRALAACLDDSEAEAVAGAVASLASAEAENRDVWLTAYAHGMPPRGRTLMRPSHVRLVATGPSERDAMAGRCPAGPSGLLPAALELYGLELARLRSALGQAGASAGDVRRHPFVTALTVLLSSATAELLRCAPALDAAVGLDLAVWGRNFFA